MSWRNIWKTFEISCSEEMIRPGLQLQGGLEKLILTQSVPAFEAPLAFCRDHRSSGTAGGSESFGRLQSFVWIPGFQQQPGYETHQEICRVVNSFQFHSNEH